MNAINDVLVEISVVLGDTMMPIDLLLRMGRGAVIDLDVDVEQQVSIFANGKLIAKGEIVIAGENIAVSITDSYLVPSE